MCCHSPFPHRFFFERSSCLFSACLLLAHCASRGHYTPKHGSWLNMAEIELSILARDCLDRRIPGPEALRRETAAWEADRNARAARMKWRFTTADARIRLHHLYPTLLP